MVWIQLQVTSFGCHFQTFFIHKVDCLQICTLGTATLVAVHVASPFLILLTFRGAIQ